MKSFKCQKCGFFFSLEADFENMDKEEYEVITACPCGEKMEEVEFSADYIPTINTRSVAVKRCCGNCKYGHYDEMQGYVCVNSDSEYVADFVEYENWCEEFVEKE